MLGLEPLYKQSAKTYQFLAWWGGGGKEKRERKKQGKKSTWHSYGRYLSKREEVRMVHTSGVCVARLPESETCCEAGVH
jgi:hypothetical protein